MDKEIEKKIELTVDWLRSKVHKSGTKGLAVGLSGGIDSAVVAFLIKKAFPDDSLGIIMPCKSDPKDKEEAIKSAEACDIRYIDIELSSVHEMLLGNIMKIMNNNNLLENQNNLKISDANLRARLRMSTIYCVSNFLNYLVVGTDNAAELYTGYFTKHGDGGVDLLPIANLKKREVYEWGRYLGVPQSIIDRPPSAGLWEGQTDEQEMGTTYEMVDNLLAGKEIQKKDKEIIEKLHERSEHKRKTPAKPPVF